MAVVTPLNNFLGPEGDTVTVDEQLLNTEYNMETGGAHCAQGDTWAVKLTCTFYAQSRHHWHIHSSQSSVVISRGTASRNTSRWHFS
jgi:hypothetical protein